jgi:methyl-accepting chemotaxis protein
MAELRTEIGGLLTIGASVDSAESFARHTRAIGQTIHLITHVADASNLTDDPELDSYYVMNVLIFQGPELAEVVAEARGLGSSV